VCQEDEAPRFQDNQLMKVVTAALGTDRLYTPGNNTGTHFCYRLSRPQVQSAVGRIMSMKNSGDTIGNRTRDLPACSTVPRQTAPFMEGIYNYMPETNHVTRVSSVAAVL